MNTRSLITIKPAYFIFICLILLVGFSYSLQWVTVSKAQQNDEHSILSTLNPNYEVTEYRTEFSKTYLYPDNSGEVIVMSFPIHAQNGLGEWINQSGLTPDDQVDKEAAKDSSTQSGSPNNQAGNQARIYMGNNVYGQTKLFIQFDIPSLPTNAIVNNATVNLYQYSGGGYSAQPCRITANWIEYGTGGLTYNNQPGVADCEAYQAVGTDAGYKSWNITNYVNGWRNGSFPNYGVRLNVQNESAPGSYFRSREYSSSQPYMRIVFTVPVPPTPTPFPTIIPAPTPVPTPPPNSCVMPFFSQVNGQWKNHPLRSGGACSSYCGTIGNCGCTLTSAAMIYKFYGATTTSQNKEMNPKNLSDCMWTKACPFYWLTGQACGRNKTNYLGQVGFSWNTLSQEINQNKRPVILYLKKGTRTHWVVVFRGSGSNPADYYINDPAMLAGANIKLSTRTNTGWVPQTIAKFSGPFTCGNIVADTSFIDPDSWQPAAVQTTTSTTTPADTPLNLTPALTTTSPITGNIWIYTASDITMTLQLTATSSEADITDMVVWTDTITNTTWQPFSEYIWLPVSEAVYVRYRDANGNVSDVFTTYLDPGGPPEPIEPLNLFLPYISSE